VVGDGLLMNHTLVRPDFTDNRIYSYANLSRRVTQEQLNLNATNTWTNQFVYDQRVPGGPGALTTAGPTNSNFGLWWSGIPTPSRASTWNTTTPSAFSLTASSTASPPSPPGWTTNPFKSSMSHQQHAVADLHRTLAGSASIEGQRPASQRLFHRLGDQLVYQQHPEPGHHRHL